jgi:hypothetical protein
MPGLQRFSQLAGGLSRDRRVRSRWSSGSDVTADMTIHELYLALRDTDYIVGLRLRKLVHKWPSPSDRQCSGSGDTPRKWPNFLRRGENFRGGHARAVYRLGVYLDKDNHILGFLDQPSRAADCVAFSLLDINSKRNVLRWVVTNRICSHYPNLVHTVRG